MQIGVIVGSLRGGQALLFVTPEHKRSVPECLKNGTDK